MSQFKFKNIILCGFRATGKSTIAKALARKLGWQMIEMDRVLEQKAGMSISQLTRQGKDWDKFRNMEHNLLVELLNLDDVVISAGGGVGVNAQTGDQNYDVITAAAKVGLLTEASTLVLVLTATPEIIKKRLQVQQRLTLKSRPILNSQNNTKSTQAQDELENIVNDSLLTFLERKSLYDRLSSKQLDTGANSIDTIVQQIINLIL